MAIVASLTEKVATLPNTFCRARYTKSSLAAYVTHLNFRNYQHKQTPL